MTRVPTLEQLFGYAILAGAVPMSWTIVRDARRGWVYDDEDDVTYRRRERPWVFVVHHGLQLALLAVLVLTGLGVLGFLGWTKQ